MNIVWNADKYTRDFSFVHQYGNGVAELIDAADNSAVLDLGCGNGALSRGLSDKGFRVTGIDASEALLAVARAQYPDLCFMQADATDFSLKEPVDVVFSNAVFHWIEAKKQPAMLSCVHHALKKSGQFVFEFGGQGNNQLIHTALAGVFSEHGYPYEIPFYFPTIGEYSFLLERAGFRVTFAVLFDRPTALKGEAGLMDWIEMFIKAPFTAIAAQEERAAIIKQTVERLRPKLLRDGTWYADYVRIRMKAIRL